MRLPADGLTARIVRPSLCTVLALALGACGVIGGGASAGDLPLASVPSIGPEGDYPVVVGEPYTIGGLAYTPEDVMNYDQVGYLAADPAGGNSVSGSHHTLPLPSYVEVTSLETGRTIVVRLERRGPMNGHSLIALSSGALAQLGAASGAPVRVRRVNPPEDQRALLRAGGAAEPRMDTPMALVEILKRKLPAPEAAPQPVLAAAPPPAPVPAPVPQAGRAAPPPLPPLDSRGFAPAPQPVATSDSGFVVQAAAFSTSDRAQSVARVIGGEVSRSGVYFRVRTGPFATRGEAEASLAKVRAAGYTDARILTNG